MKFMASVAKKLVGLLCAIASTCSALDYVYERDLIAATLILEAGGENHVYSMVAVYEVIRNRSISRSQTMRDVILAPRQFSCWNNIERRKELFNHATQHPKFDLALSIVRQDRPTNITRGATMYHATRVLPFWKTSYTETITIQNHIFYK